MKPLRKSFDATGLFPFTMNYRDTKSPQFELPDHVHDWHELVFVHSGKGTFFIHNALYEMKAGDLYIIPANTIHRSMPDDNDPVTSTAVFFSPTFVKSPSFDEQWQPERMFHTAIHLYALENAELIRFEHALAAMKAELDERQEGYRTAVWLQLLGALHGACRFQSRNASPPYRASAGYPDWLDEILAHVESELDRADGDKMSLSTLARIANVSAAHFSRVFRQKTGMNVTDYLTTRRIIKAKRLLASSNDKVSWIAAACGFDSMTYFHRSFKKHAGMTPAQYRDAHYEE